MIPLTLSLSPPLSLLPQLNNSSRRTFFLNQKNKKLLLQRRRGICICKAELHQDAPFAIAIGACVLNSLLFSDTAVTFPEDDEDAAVSSTDARFAVMTIIAFIPYFNWLSWIFALTDTGKRRYAVYALVYLAPYFRTNLSLSPEESWLPIASIVLCVIHIQLEASIKSGDLESFKFFNEVAKRLGLVKKHSHMKHPEEMHKEAKGQGKMKLPLGEQSRDEIRKWRVPTKPSKDFENEDEDDGNLDDRMQH